MGIVGNFSRGWSFMKQALAMLKEEPRLMRPSMISVLVSVAYFLLWAMIFVGSEIDLDGGAAYALGAIATFGAFCIFYFFCGMTVNMVDVHLEGGTPDMGEAYRDAKKNLGAICALSVVSTIVELLANAARGRHGRGGFAIVGRIVASLIETVWTVMSFLLLPAIIIEDISLPQALRRVRDLHGQNKLLIGVGEVGVRMVTGLLGVAVVLMLVGIGFMGFVVLGGTAGVLLTVLLGGTALAAYTAFSSYLRMSYYTCLYLWSVESERQGAEALAPLPLAIALGRSRARPRGPLAA